jgi:hypothetical protein
MLLDPPRSPIVLEQAAGMFGELMVSDFEGARTMWCGLLCHGSAFLEPGLPVGGALLSPGPIPEADYLIGWLAPACLHPRGTILMAGMGPGVGVASLLCNFPELSVVAVEIDPEVIAMGRSHFPLLSHYQAEGRLTIVQDDFRHFLAARAGQRWSAVFMDAYQSGTSLYCPGRMLETLRGHSDSLWLNLLDCIGGPRMRSVIRQLAAAGWPLGSALPVSHIEPGMEFQSGNILVGSDLLHGRAEVRAFTPFAGFDHERAATARRIYARMMEHAKPLQPRVGAED